MRLIGLGHADRPAIIADQVRLTHGELAALVEHAADQWPGDGSRRLVLIEPMARVDAVVSYLAALRAGHVVLLAPPGRSAEMATVWEPDDYARPLHATWQVRHGPSQSRHTLHPDLSLLLSTSGSSGSPRLVRLSAQSVMANGRDIAEALQLTPLDRGITTLPLHYCYGLSVLHAHLMAGASVVLTDRSVSDHQLWDLMARERVSTLSAVPHTFDLLEAGRIQVATVPSLRLITQAGGRMDPAKVRLWAARGARSGWDLRVMYGQTEATARMTITATGQSRRDPATVGAPIGAGRIAVRDGGIDVPKGTVGELCYEGPNVMMGYATSPADLARGPETPYLATGDLGRVRPDGCVEIVGRRVGFLKIAGLRIDVERAELLLGRAGITALVGGTDEELRAVVVTEGVDDALDRARRRLGEATGLPPHRIGVAPVAALPRHPNGKPDRGAARSAYEAWASRANDERSDERDSVRLAIADYALVLGRTDVSAASTFISLGGDSLSYVELAVRLESRLGRLPDDWPERPIRELAAGTDDQRGGVWAHIDVTIPMRALAILAIVGSHVHLWKILGGAHILLGIAGYNFARFAANAPTVTDLWRRVGGTLARIVLPVSAFVAAIGVWRGTYTPANLAMVNWFVGSPTWNSTWRLWFIEALVWILLAVVCLLSIPAVRDAHRRNPFAVAATIAVVAAFARLAALDLTSPPGRGTAPAVLWLFAIGWAAYAAGTTRQRLLLSAVVVATLPGFLDNPIREATIGAGLLAVIWVRGVHVPRALLPALTAVAGASLFIYVTHFEVYRLTDEPLANLGLSLAVGLGTWWVATRAPRSIRRRLPDTTAPAATDPHSEYVP